MRDDKGRLLDILEAIEKINSKINPDRSEFESNELLQVWGVHYLQIIGEAVYNLSEDIQQRYPDLPWRNMIGMRHILVHHYFETDIDIVWDAIVNDLPALKEQVTMIFAQL